MDFSVDAGVILPHVRAVSPADAARLAFAELGERTKFPVTVSDRSSNRTYLFLGVPPEEETMPKSERDSRCFVRAVERGQHTFTLVAQDRSSPRTILFWMLENVESAPEEKLREALDDALIMRAFPTRKAAD